MLREEKGAVAIIIALLMVVFLGFAALVIDVGALYEERRQDQTAADAAALAGAQQLPDDPAGATNTAVNYVSLNHKTVTASAVEIKTTYIANDTIKVTVKSTVNYTFAQVLGFSSGDVSASATAVVGSPTTFGGKKLMPWARMDYPFIFGQEYVLFRSTDPSFGNFQAIQLPYIDPNTGQVNPSPGMVEYADLVAGQNNQGQPIVAADVSLHQLLETKTGNFGVNTKRALDTRLNGDTCAFSDVVDANGQIKNYSCPRIIVIVSVVNAQDGSLNWPTGTSTKVEVVRFNYFFIKGYVSKPNEGDYVTGIFIRTLTAEEARIGAYDPKSGIKIVKLVQ